MAFANVIVDISLEKLDRSFQYRIPEELAGQVVPGVQVTVSFGRRTMTGYVVEVVEEAAYDPEKIKPVLSVVRDSVAIESQLIALAAWMRQNYGSTMNQALKTVLPVKQKAKPVEQRTLRLLLSDREAAEKLALYENRHYVAKARLLRELMKQNMLDYGTVIHKLHISSAVIKGMESQQILAVDTSRRYRNPVEHLTGSGYTLTLNSGQQAVADRIISDMDQGIRDTYLLKGVTGSGKTEVYMELIAHVVSGGRQAIVLIPEIALTYQTVMRFYNRFGDRVSILNSRLSAGERYDQYLRAKNGNIDIMIGPRSALFTPFSRLGLIVIDEEHETSYKSETAPRYHAREVAIERARVSGASVVLGSATPSVESFYRAKEGEYRLLELNERVQKKPLPVCEVVDLRQELLRGNRSILSLRLQELMEERLSKGQQSMLFLNRRGLAGFMSCRACGAVVKCPHCDVSLSLHNNGKMVCHYCGYEEREPKRCPSCGSPYIGGFKAGTQKIEQIVKQRFPDARILRMDFDTTRTKDSYEQILSAFANREADILIGTQMIVKGHDFPNVTLVGILAADMSLHLADFHGAERTFALLTQAAGRAGRGVEPGQVVIQTYDPKHYAIVTAKEQDYERFYAQEIEYRRMLCYPPVWNLLLISAASASEEALQRGCVFLKEELERLLRKARDEGGQGAPVQMIGPADASIARISDIYRKVLYLKTEDYRKLVAWKDAIENLTKEEALFKEVTVQFDFNPVSGF